MNYRPIYLVILCLAVLFGSACKSAPAEQPDELLGLPPTEKEDPFFFVTLPAEAKKATASGTIGDEENATPKASTNTKASEKKAELPTKFRCFSCVKICEDKACEDADSICGWGADYEKESAMLRATAECDGALNLARSNPQWKRVSGSCPVATCQ